MTTVEKVIVGAAVGAGFYFLVKSSAASTPITDPRAGETDVMKYHAPIWTWGTRDNVEPALIASVIYRESRGKSGAIGAQGEVGLMQVKRSTAAMFFPGITDADLLEPVHNISAGAKYLRYCLDEFNGSIPAALCAYNAGPSRVWIDDSRGGKIVAPAAAKEYARAVMGRIPRFRALFQSMAEYIRYGWNFRPGDWFLNFDKFDGLGFFPGRGYLYNLEQYNAGRRIPGECPVPPRGLGLRQGTRWLYQRGF